MNNGYVYLVYNIRTNHFYVGKQSNPKKIIGVNYFTSSSSKHINALWFRSEFNKSNALQTDWQCDILYTGADFDKQEMIEIMHRGLYHPVENPLSLNYHVRNQQFSTFGYLLARNKDGAKMVVAKDDTRLLTNELVPYFKGYNNITNGVENRKLKVGDIMPLGFKIGMTRRATPKKIWITNGIENKLISFNDAIPLLFKQGRTCIKGVNINITNGVTNKRIPTSAPIPEGFWQGSYKTREKK